MRIPLAIAILTVSLAGCSESAPPAEVDDGPAPDEVASGKGVIRGIVIDGAITPVPDATVSVAALGLETTTDADGAFLFIDVEPGTYFIEASKVGWTSIQGSTVVEADVLRPELVRLQIIPVPGTEPMVITLVQSGFIACGASTTATVHSVCSDAQLNEDRSHVLFEIPVKPDHYQVEIVWKSTQVLATSLYTIHYMYDFPNETLMGGFDFRLCEFGGESPLICSLGPEELAAFDIGGGIGVDVAMFSDGPAGNGAALDQPFDVYMSLFYNMAPDDEWTFVEDGEHPVPT